MVAPLLRHHRQASAARGLGQAIPVLQEPPEPAVQGRRVRKARRRRKNWEGGGGARAGAFCIPAEAVNEPIILPQAQLVVTKSSLALTHLPERDGRTRTGLETRTGQDRIGQDTTGHTSTREKHARRVRRKYRTVLLPSFLKAGMLHLKPILMATSVAVEPLSVKNTLDAQPLPGPSTSLSATCTRAPDTIRKITMLPRRREKGCSDRLVLLFSLEEKNLNPRESRLCGFLH